MSLFLMEKKPNNNKQKNPQKRNKLRTKFECRRKVHHSVLPWILILDKENQPSPSCFPRWCAVKGFNEPQIVLCSLHGSREQKSRGKKRLVLFLSPQGCIFTADHVDLAASVPLMLMELKSHQVLTNVSLGVCKASLSLQIKSTDPVWWWFLSPASCGVLWGI